MIILPEDLFERLEPIPPLEVKRRYKLSNFRFHTDQVSLFVMGVSEKMDNLVLHSR